MKPKKRKKWLYVLLIVAGLFVIAAIQGMLDKPKLRPVKSTQQTVKPVSRPTYTPTSKPSGIVFKKDLINIKTVKKHPKLKTETEQLAYWYRYNSIAYALRYRKPEKAGEHNRKFQSYKYTLDKERYYEIMNLADTDYHNAKD